MSEMTSDSSDLAAVLAGDRQAFARLYTRHAAVVLSICRRCTSLDQAEDAMQETFIRAFRKIDQLREPGGFRAWLYSIARRVCSERRRSQKRRQRHEAKAGELHVITANPGPEQDPVEQAEQLEQLSHALDTLADDERLAIHLFYLEPDPPQAAADALGVSRSGYYKLVRRARNRLASAMKEVQPS